MTGHDWTGQEQGNNRVTLDKGATLDDNRATLDDDGTLHNNFYHLPVYSP